MSVTGVDGYSTINKQRLSAKKEEWKKSSGKGLTFSLTTAPVVPIDNNASVSL